MCSRIAGSSSLDSRNHDSTSALESFAVAEPIRATVPQSGCGVPCRTGPGNSSRPHCRPDLQSLLISVAGARAAQVRPTDLIARWRRDRFVQPSECDPRRVSAVETGLWQLLPDAFVGIDLSPVAPLGSCIAVAPVSQNRIVTTMRLSEVVADSTNALAIEAAVRRLDQPPGGQVHVAASHRQMRAQIFGPGAAAHFRLFALVSSARDTGSARTELDLLRRHLAVWIAVLETIPHRQPQIELTVFDHPVLAARLADTVLPANSSDAVQLIEEPTREHGRGYYTGLAMRLTADAGSLEIGTAVSPPGPRSSPATPRNAASSPASRRNDLPI